MKFRILFKLFLAVTLIVMVNTAHAQRIKGALIAGFNLSQVDGDEVYGFKKFGFVGGPSAIIPLTSKWSVSLETIFNQKGSHQKKQYSDSSSLLGEKITGAYDLKLNYVEIPVLIHYEDRNTMTVGTGFSWGRLVGVKEWEHGRRTATDLSGPYKRNDIDWLFDLRIRVYQKLKFNLRYSYSIPEIRKREFTNVDGTRTWDRKQYNNYISFRLIYIFNEKLENVKNKQ